MDDEIAAKYVLLDFEAITLIALAMGVLAYAIGRRIRRAPLDRFGDAPVDYDGFDLILMFFPAMLFLQNPILGVLTAGKEEAANASVAAPSALKIMLLNLAVYLVAGVITYGLIAWVRLRSISDLFGLRRLRLSNIIVISILAGVFSFLACAWLVGEFSNSLLEDVFGKLDLQEAVKMMRESQTPSHLILSLLVACIAAPLVEELLFRGYMYGTLRRLTHPIFAAFVIGGLFAVAHGNLPALLPLWAFSILLCLAYEISGCLWVPVGMHVFFNAANIVLMMMPEPLE